MDVPSGDGVGVDVIGVVVGSEMVEVDVVVVEWVLYYSSLVDLCLCPPYLKQIIYNN